jgi:diadenosine tetraphosphate (Ap4A) HIT family hydrolase
MTRDKCHLCSQLAGDSENDLLSIICSDKVYFKRVLMETRNFGLIPSVGPLAIGHMLLCPKVHCCSFRDINAALDSEFLKLKTRIRSLLAQTFGKPVHCFEHGMRSDGSRILCTVDHAHLHFVPASLDMRKALRYEQPPWIEFDGSLRALRELVRTDEYLVYESPFGRCAVAPARNEEFGSQYIRKAFSRQLGESLTWNWREFPKIEDINATWNQILSVLP